MSRIRDALRRLGRYLADKESPPPTRLSEQEAIGLAEAAAERAGHGLDAPIGARAHYDDAGRLVWTIMSSADMIGGHVFVRIDDDTGETIGIQVLPR